MIQKIKDFFDFGRSEFRGILIFLCVISLLIGLNFIFSSNKRQSIFSDKAFANEVTNFEIRQQQIADSISKSKKQWNHKEKSEVSFLSIDKSVMENELNPFPFNPNNLSEELWKKMGLTDKQIKSIKNFESKGGKFRTKDDFKKMYTISADEYAILEPFITIPQDSVKKFTPKKTTFARNIIELNSTDSIELQKVPGIGVGLSRRIIIQRNKLGGFYSINQLEEIYGIDSARYQKIKPYLTIDVNKITKININTADVKDLLKHPYLDLYMSKSIVVHRKKIGRYTSIKQIKDAALIYEELYQKLIPYLSID